MEKKKSAHENVCSVLVWACVCIHIFVWNNFLFFKYIAIRCWTLIFNDATSIDCFYLMCSLKLQISFISLSIVVCVCVLLFLFEFWSFEPQSENSKMVGVVVAFAIILLFFACTTDALKFYALIFIHIIRFSFLFEKVCNCCAILNSITCVSVCCCVVSRLWNMNGRAKLCSFDQFYCDLLYQLTKLDVFSLNNASFSFLIHSWTHDDSIFCFVVIFSSIDVVIW